MKVLSIQKGADTGGQGFRIKRAFDKYARGWTFRAMTSPPVADYIAYPADLRWSHKIIRSMWRRLDVIHAHNNFRTLAWLERRHKHVTRKPTVIHYHGTQFRQNAPVFLAEQRERRAIGIVSTLDLYLLAPDELEWLPAPYDVDWLASLRAPKDDGIIRIGHAPTNEQVKSTPQFVAAVKRLQREGFPVEMELIQQTTWADCLARKATVDIFFDQVALGFGCNSLEAWGMGIPVIAGVDPERAKAIGHEIPDNVLAHMEQRFGSLPFYPATESTVYDALRELVENPGLREDMAQRGHQYVRRFHDEPVVVKQLQGIYERAAECFAPASIAGGSLSEPAA